MKHEEMIAVIEAHKNGKKLQTRRRLSDNTWVPSRVTCWDFSVFDYRVKPEPRECWVTVPVGQTFQTSRRVTIFPCEKAACDACGTHYEVVHMREVIE